MKSERNLFVNQQRTIKILMSTKNVVDDDLSSSSSSNSSSSKLQNHNNNISDNIRRKLEKSFHNFNYKYKRREIFKNNNNNQMVLSDDQNNYCNYKILIIIKILFIYFVSKNIVEFLIRKFLNCIKEFHLNYVKFMKMLFYNLITKLTASSTNNTTTVKQQQQSIGLFLSIAIILIALSGFADVTEAGACWLQRMENGKCKELFSKNMSKEECCKNSNEFAYTLTELSDTEYFFAMAIGDGHTCASCLESCDNAKCSPGKRCVIRKGQPKCICSPVCKSSSAGVKDRRRNNNNRNKLHQQHQQQQNKIASNNGRTGDGQQQQRRRRRKKLLIDKNHRSISYPFNQPEHHHQHQHQINGNSEIKKNSLRKFHSNNHDELINNDYQNDDKSSTSTIIKTIKNQRFKSTKNTNNKLHRKNLTTQSPPPSSLSTQIIHDDDEQQQNDDNRRNTIKRSEKFIITATGNDRFLNNSSSKILGNFNKNSSSSSSSLLLPIKPRNKKNMIMNSKNILLIQTSSSFDQSVISSNDGNNHQHHKNKNKDVQLTGSSSSSSNSNTNKRNRQHKIKNADHHHQLTNHISLNGNINSSSILLDNHHHHRQHHHHRKNKDQRYPQQRQPINNIQMNNHNRSISRHDDSLHYNNNNRRRQEIHQHQLQQNKKQHLISLDERIRNGFFNHGFPNPEFDLTQPEHQLQIFNGGNSGGSVASYANPVCGTDGRTYRTECQLKKRACRREITTLTVAYRGHCQTSCKSVRCLKNLTCVEDQYGIPHCIECDINCPQDDLTSGGGGGGSKFFDIKKSVCGVDGHTYKSVCDINRQVCLTGRSIAIAYQGPCKDESTCNNVHCGSRMLCLTDLVTLKPRCVSCSFKCPRKKRSQGDRFADAKICGNNNHTYHSWCHMRRDSCNTAFYIDIKHLGACHKDSFPKNLMDPYQ